MYNKTRVLNVHLMQDMFLGEIIGAIFLADDNSWLNPTLQIRPVKVLATGIESEDGQLVIDEKQGKSVTILENVDVMAYYDLFTFRLCDEKQSAVVGSFAEQKRRWSRPPN